MTEKDRSCARGPYVVDAQFHTRRNVYHRFAEHADTLDVDALSATTLCRELGIARATFYRHFGSVEGFFNRMLADLLDETLAGMPPVLSLHQALTVQYSKLAEGRQLYGVLLCERLRGPVKHIAQKRLAQHLNHLANAAEVSVSPYEVYGIASCLPGLSLQYLAAEKPSPPAVVASHAVSALSDRVLAFAGSSFVWSA